MPETVREYKPRRRRIAVREIAVVFGWTLVVAAVVALLGTAGYSFVYFFGGLR